MTACGLDFGTSNSAIGVVKDGDACLAPVEDEATLVPTSVFFDFANGDKASFGRAAIAAYVEGAEGRLMRSLKSVLGSSLIDEATGLSRRRVAFTDVIAIFVRHLKARAEAFLGREINHVVHGRPVRFMDDVAADARAEGALAMIARRAGFRDVSFVYEPIAAAYHYEKTASREELVLVGDIGGGTSDFSLVRIGPQRRGRIDRSGDILASTGTRIGGTDFDRELSLDRVMPLLGMRSQLADRSLSMPRALFSEFANWATINRLYRPAQVREIEMLHRQALQPEKTKRLLAAVKGFYGHQIAARVEAAKIALSAQETTEIDLDFLETDLRPETTRKDFERAIAESIDRLSATAARCLTDAGLGSEAISTVFLTGGSCRVPAVRDAITRIAPSAAIAQGADFLSVALELTEHAARVYGN